jgi:hypothetical protein
MQYKLHTFLAASLLSIGSFVAQAQTTSTFEDVILPGADTGFLETKYPNNGTYTFPSGNALFYGNVSWGSSWGNFNCSNATDTTETSYAKAAVAIPGSGYNSSANYAIAYVPIDFMGPVPTATIPVGAKLQGAAAHEQVFGAYFSNSVYAYRYMLQGNKYANSHFWLRLIVRGYDNGVKSADSVIFTLADYTNTANAVLVNNWQWVNLTPLGNVDSLTFDMVSNDTAGGFGINTPAYFAMDNLITSDGQCPAPLNLTASGITVNDVQLNWTNGISGITPAYEVAIDQSATLAPTVATTTVNATTHAVSGLTVNTTYYAHIRSACSNGGFSAWDTVTFKTAPGLGIFNTPANTLQVSISPNPAVNTLNITAAVPANATIYSIEGREIMTVNRAQKIDISNLANGVYIIKVTDLKGISSATLRFAKTN